MTDTPKTLDALVARMSSFEQELKEFKKSQQKERQKTIRDGTKALEKAIGDKNAPLLDRWRIFAAAPLEFKNELQDITQLPDEPNMQFYLEALLGEQNRGSTAEIEADMMLYYMERGVKDPSWDEAVDLTALMEVILKHNIGSVVLDW